MNQLLRPNLLTRFVLTFALAAVFGGCGDPVSAPRLEPAQRFEIGSAPDVLGTRGEHEGNLEASGVIAPRTLEEAHGFARGAGVTAAPWAAP